MNQHQGTFLMVERCIQLAIEIDSIFKLSKALFEDYTISLVADLHRVEHLRSVFHDFGKRDPTPVTSLAELNFPNEATGGR